MKTKTKLQLMTANNDFKRRMKKLTVSRGLGMRM